MCLDALSCRCCIMAGTVNHIGIERALGQECNWACLLFQADSLFLKDANKLCADDLTFLLRVDYTGKACQETLAGIDDNQRNVQGTAELIDDRVSLTRTQAAGIDQG